MRKRQEFNHIILGQIKNLKRIFKINRINCVIGERKIQCKNCNNKFTKSGTFYAVFLFLFFILNSFCSSASSRNRADQSRFSKPEKIVIPGTIVNRVRFIVGSESITQLDIDLMKKRLLKTRKARGKNSTKTAINELIEHAIVAIEAEKQTIIVSDLRIENEINRRMQRMGISNKKKFEKITQRETGIPYTIWLEELRYDLIKQQVVRIALTVPAATEREIEKFYRNNRRKVGVEIRYREMVFLTRGGIHNESKTSQIANEAYRKVRSNPSGFADVARNNPSNVASSKPYGGLHNYVELSGIAQKNKILAGVLYNTGVGQVSRVFRDSRGRYMIIRLEARRPVPIAKVRDLIRQRLYFEKQGKVFENWMKKRKAEIAIVVVK